MTGQTQHVQIDGRFHVLAAAPHPEVLVVFLQGVGQRQRETPAIALDELGQQDGRRGEEGAVGHTGRGLQGVVHRGLGVDAPQIVVERRAVRPAGRRLIALGEELGLDQHTVRQGPRAPTTSARATAWCHWCGLGR